MLKKTLYLPKKEAREGEKISGRTPMGTGVPAQDDLPCGRCESLTTCHGGGFDE